MYVANMKRINIDFKIIITVLDFEDVAADAGCFGLNER